MAEIIAATTAAAEGTFECTGAASIQVVGLAADEWVTLFFQYEGGAYYPATTVGKGGRINHTEMPKLLVAPGLYKIVKDVTANSVAVAVL